MPTRIADLIVISGGRVLFLAVKSPSGRLRKSQEVFRDTVVTQGFCWALVRSIDDALGNLAGHGFTTPADVCFGRGETILAERRLIK